MLQPVARLRFRNNWMEPILLQLVWIQRFASSHKTAKTQKTKKNKKNSIYSILPNLGCESFDITFLVDMLTLAEDLSIKDKID